MTSESGERFFVRFRKNLTDSNQAEEARLRPSFLTESNQSNAVVLGTGSDAGLDLDRSGEDNGYYHVCKNAHDVQFKFVGGDRQGIHRLSRASTI